MIAFVLQQKVKTTNSNSAQHTQADQVIQNKITSNVVFYGLVVFYFVARQMQSSVCAQLYSVVCGVGNDCCTKCWSEADHCPHHSPPLVSHTHSINQSIMSLVYSDHAGGNEKLVSMMSSLLVCGNDDRIGALNRRVKHNDELKVSPLTHTHILLMHTIHMLTHSHCKGTSFVPRPLYCGENEGGIRGYVHTHTHSWIMLYSGVFSRVNIFTKTRQIPFSIEFHNFYFDHR